MQGRKKLPQTAAGECRMAGVPLREPPEPPAFLTDGAKRRFREVIEQLTDIGALAETDAGVVARYAAIYDRWEQAEAALASSGPIHYARLTNRAGQPASAVALPAMAQAAKCHDQLCKLESALGLNPVERTRLPAARDRGPTDPAEKWFAAAWGDDDA
jgi:P27 family predicted phage terminase small subunit